MKEFSNYLEIGVFSFIVLLCGRVYKNQSKKKKEFDVLFHETKNDLTKSRVYKFVLTGGPCAGKTTALERFQGYFKERGIHIIFFKLLLVFSCLLFITF